MMRFLTALLFLFHICLPIVSCTSSNTEEDAVDAGAPIDDSELKGSDAGVEKDEFAENDTVNEKPAEDDLEKDLDEQTAKEEPPPATAEEKFEEKPAEKLEEKLDDEIAGGEELAPPPQEVAPTPEPAPVAPVPEKIKVRNIRYISNASGGTVVIETSQPVAYQTRLNAATQQFVIEMAGVELPEALQRPYPTNAFNTRIGSINAYQAAGSDTARVVIQLTGAGGGEPVVQQEGASLVVIPPAPPVIAEKPAPSPVAETPDNQQALSARTLDEFLTGNQKFFGRMISFQVKDADVRDVINFLAEESGANIVMSDDVKGTISIKIRRVPWDQALVTVMRTKELGYVRQGNVLRISTLKALQSETEAASKIIAAGKELVPAMVQVIPVNFAAMEDISKHVASFLSKDGKVVADSRTNTLIVTDKAEVIERVQKIVKTLDVPPGQVSIESKIVEAGEDFDSFVGVNWSFSGADVPLSTSGGNNGAPVNMNLNSHSATLSRDFSGAGPFSAGLVVGTLDVFGDLAASLSLAERDSLAKVISAPRISVMNREKASISQQGENVSVITTRSEQTGSITKQEKRTPFSLDLTVTPQITAEGSVIMDLDVKRQFLGATVDAETAARPVNTRSAHTKILVGNGQTAVIGGIYTSDELEAMNGVPGLMHIPVLGWLFKNKAKNRSKNELLIFLTPRILSQEENRSQTL